LKPGGHLLSFGGSRTYHRMACAIEDAGFEIRDQIMWVYGSGFPKSLNIGKAIDKLQGNKREIVGVGKSGKPKTHTSSLNMSQVKNNTFGGEFNISKGNSDWEGYGTSLKPAHEPIVVARKPLSEKTVVANILKWGVGGINIDDCRIKYTKDNPPIPQLAQGKTKINSDKSMYGGNSLLKSKTKCAVGGSLDGRFPANFIHDGSQEVVELFPNTKAGVAVRHNSGGNTFGGENKKPPMDDIGYGDSGSAARFFYCAKASKSERDRGCERNNHPTVKPLALMKYLVKLISREGQTVLDPFMGSGTTGVAAKELGRSFIGIEISPKYFEIAKRRIDNTMENLL